jgi:hypothetical protein
MRKPASKKGMPLAQTMAPRNRGQNPMMPQSLAAAAPKVNDSSAR